MDEILPHLTKLKDELTKKQGKSAVQSTLNTLKENIRRTPMYASVMRSSQVQTYNAAKRHTLFVQSNNKTSEDIKDELINKVNPKKDKIKMKGIRQSRTNSAVMDPTLAVIHKNLKITRFTSDTTTKEEEFLLILYDIDSSLTANELKENIIQHNPDEFSIEEEDIIPRFKTGPNI